MPSEEGERLLRLVRWLLLRQSARGGEIRVLTGFNDQRAGWQEVRADWFSWNTVLSVPWRAPMHINVAEAYARLLGVKWRVQQPTETGLRYLNLMDSQANLAHAAKGRGASTRMRHVELQISAYQAAGHLREIGGYVRSDRNPADSGSRDTARWKRQRGLESSCCGRFGGFRQFPELPPQHRFPWQGPQIYWNGSAPLMRCLASDTPYRSSSIIKLD